MNLEDGLRRSKRKAHEALASAAADESDTPTSPAQKKARGVILKVNPPATRMNTAAKPLAWNSAHQSVGKTPAAQKPAVRTTVTRALAAKKNAKASVNSNLLAFPFFSLPEKAALLVTRHLPVDDLFNFRISCKILWAISWPAFKALFHSTAVFVEGRSWKIWSTGNTHSHDTTLDDVSEQAVLEDTSLEILCQISEHPLLRDAIYELRLVVCRWKEQESYTTQPPTGPDFKALLWQYTGFRSHPYPILRADNESDFSRLDVVNNRLVSALSRLPNVTSIIIGDRQAEHAIGSRMLQRRLGLMPNTMFRDYEKCFIYEQPYYEGSLLRAMMMLFSTLSDLETVPIRKLTIESLQNGKQFRGLPLQLFEMSKNQTKAMERVFSAMNQLNLQIDAKEPVEGPGMPGCIFSIDSLEDADASFTTWKVLPQMLTMSQNLTQLHLEFGGGEISHHGQNGYTQYLSTLLERMTLQKMIDFRLVGQSAPQASIKAFLSRHARTLKILELGKMSLPYGALEGTAQCHSLRHPTRVSFSQDQANVACPWTSMYWYDVLSFMVKTLGSPYAHDYLDLERIHLWQLEDDGRLQLFPGQGLVIEGGDVRDCLTGTMKEVREWTDRRVKELPVKEAKAKRKTKSKALAGKSSKALSGSEIGLRRSGRVRKSI
jgi:hypothetical protein